MPGAFVSLRHGRPLQRQEDRYSDKKLLAALAVKGEIIIGVSQAAQALGPAALQVEWKDFVPHFLAAKIRQRLFAQVELPDLQLSDAPSPQWTPRLD